MRKGVRDIIFGTCMLAVGGLLWWETSKPRYQADKVQDYGFDPAFFPRVLLGLWFLLTIVILARSVVVWSQEVEPQNWGRLAGSVVLSAAYIWLMDGIGFLFASVAFAIAIMVFLGLRRPMWIGLVGVLFPLLTWYCFVFLLQIPLPTSPWFVRL